MCKENDDVGGEDESVFLYCNDAVSFDVSFIYVQLLGRAITSVQQYHLAGIGCTKLSERSILTIPST